MSGPLLWDVDTQVDFVHAAGKLPVPGAEAAVPAMAKLVRWAEERGIPHLATADDHELTDPEISDEPDFEIRIAGQEECDGFEELRVILHRLESCDADERGARLAARTRTVSGTRNQVRPVASASAMSVEPMPVPNAPTAP